MPNDITAEPPAFVQGVARRLIPVRWPRSQKLLGYYDLDAGALVYQDARGRELDRVDLSVYNRGHEPAQR